MKKNFKTNIFIFSLSILLISFQFSCRETIIEPNIIKLQLFSVKVGTQTLDLQNLEKNTQIQTDKPILLEFSNSVDTTNIAANFTLTNTLENIPFKLAYLDDYKTISIIPWDSLPHNKKIELSISNNLKGSNKEQFDGIQLYFTTIAETLRVENIVFNIDTFSSEDTPSNINLLPNISLNFNKTLDPNSINNLNCKIVNASGNTISTGVNVVDKKINFTVKDTLTDLLKHTIFIGSDVKGLQEEFFSGFHSNFFTKESETNKFPLLSDDELLTLVQEKTFQYFWNGAHPVSGLARERNSSGDIVTTGGSGFGIMALIVGIERNFISRTEGISRFTKIIDFLSQADRFHGAWPHWMNGNTGAIIPFSTNDNGADLVETAFMAQGLLTLRQYLNPNQIDENQLIDKINTLLDSIEWTWFTQNGQNILYWHWSPTNGWIMNMPIKGYNEALIVYIMAATSKNYKIAAEVYHQGWAQSGNIINGKSFYNINLPLGGDYGGPLFFTHYSFLGLNPQNLSDIYANYWEQNTAHTLINRAYCIANPHNYIAYSENCWGLTASDEPDGYSAHQPTHDIGVITPTAAISSMPYAPQESIEALKFFYYKLGDRIWGEYGFKDAFDIENAWFAQSYIAIDQGPIVIMIENYRTALLWNLFMSAPEISPALDYLGFTNYKKGIK